MNPTEKNNMQQGPRSTDELLSDLQQEPAQHDGFERALAEALRHVDAPPNLLSYLESATRPVPAVVAAPVQRRAGWLAGWQLWGGAALAASLTLGVGINQFQAHERRSEATRQFETATQIEQKTLDRTREQLRERGIDLDQ